ncbi:hypothetical protein V1517DRAFT_312765 [Lipomyces orientalis]|uniref:Uncharacterized protein n=1 Tax=Lipomyces orientalis TaxID=1233043 RepID=A0ACC3TZA4_9ASCO
MWEYYQYPPSIAAAIVFVIFFTLVTVIHVYLLFRTKTWYFIQGWGGCGYPPNFPIHPPSALLKWADMYPPFHSMTDIRKYAILL